MAQPACPKWRENCDHVVKLCRLRIRQIAKVTKSGFTKSLNLKQLVLKEQNQTVIVKSKQKETVDD